MANTRSAIKRIRQTKRRALANRNNKGQLRSQVKKLRKALEANDVEAAEKQLQPTFSVLDRSVRKGVAAKNSVARAKSRLTRRFNALKSSKAKA
jgi:small subunit ribosomal protein S20